MSRARKAPARSHVSTANAADITNPGVAALVNGNSPFATEASQGDVTPEKVPTLDEVAWFDPKDGEIVQLRSALNGAQIAANDANRLLAEAKAQRNAALDEIMLLRAQMKVVAEDGQKGWAAASAARGQAH